MNDQPLVTIIIPAYNHEAFVEQALESVLHQTYKNIELIVIDDGSTDRTAERIGEVVRSAGAGKVTFLTQENHGLPRTLNRGLQLARGQYVAFLASDDAYLPTRIEEGVRALEGADVSVPASYSDGYIVNERGQKVDLFSSRYAVPVGQNQRKELMIGNWIPALSVLFRRSALLECGPFDERGAIEDYDMLLRMAARCGNMVYVPTPLFLYRRHLSNLSSDGERMGEQLEVILDKNPDMRRFRDFKVAVKGRRCGDIVAGATPLNLELSMRQAIRRVQQDQGLVNVGYVDLAGIVVGAVARRFKRQARSYILRRRGAQVGKGVKIDGKITIIGNPKNVVIADHVRVLGDVRLVTGYGLRRELIQIGPHTTVDHGAMLVSHGGQLVIGSHCFVGPRVHVQAKGGVWIGDDTMIAANTSVFASNHVTVNAQVPYHSQGERFEGITIGRNCWFGAGCIVLDGAVVGDNCVIGAGSVVRGYSAPNSRILSKEALGNSAR